MSRTVSELSSDVLVELGDSAESEFDSIRFTIVASIGAETIYELCGLHLSLIHI